MQLRNEVLGRPVGDWVRTLFLVKTYGKVFDIRKMAAATILSYIAIEA